MLNAESLCQMTIFAFVYTDSRNVGKLPIRNYFQSVVFNFTTLKVDLIVINHVVTFFKFSIPLLPHNCLSIQNKNKKWPDHLTPPDMTTNRVAHWRSRVSTIMASSFELCLIVLFVSPNFIYLNVCSRAIN